MATNNANSQRQQPPANGQSQRRPQQQTQQGESDGYDTSRRSEAVLPDHLFIGGGRRGAGASNGTRAAAGAARPAQRPAARRAPVQRQQEVETDAQDQFDDADLEALDEGGDGLSPGHAGDDSLDEDGDEAGEGEGDASGTAEGDEATAAELSEDELIDLMLQDEPGTGLLREQAQQGQRQPQRQAPKSGELTDASLISEYEFAVDKYGQEMADNLIKPRLIREQKMQQQLAAYQQHIDDQQQQVSAQAEATCYNFFSTMSQGGFAAIYGADPRSAKPIQVEAMRRVITKAAVIKAQLQAAGVPITPEKALEKAHQKLWGGTAIGQRVNANAQTMQNRSRNITVRPTRGGAGVSNGQSNAGGNTGGGSGDGGDKYANLRAALRKAGVTRGSRR